MTRLIFLDTETTGLDPDRHEVWEVAWISRSVVDLGNDLAAQRDVEQVWQLPVDHLECADPYGLRVGRWFERRFVDGMFRSTDPTSPNYPHGVALSGSVPSAGGGTVVPVHELAGRMAQLFDGATIVGAVPDFDVRFLTKWLRSYGQPWTGHYHLCDVENLAVGALKERMRTASGVRVVGEAYSPREALARVRSVTLTTCGTLSLRTLSLRISCVRCAARCIRCLRSRLTTGETFSP